MVYSFAFMGAVASLAAWFLYKSNDKKSSILQITFFTSLAIFLIAVLTEEAAFDVKLRTLFRDFSVMALFGLFFQVVTIHKKWLVQSVVIALAAFVFYQQQFMSNNFQTEDFSGITYDASGELLLELAEHTSTEVLATVVRKYDLDLLPAFSPGSPETTELDDYYVVDVPAVYSSQLEQIMSELQAVPEVDWVEPNETISIDPIVEKKTIKANKKYGLNDPGLEKLWGFESMEVDRLYAYLENRSLKPRKRALVAILDTGVDAKHEDLSDNFYSLESKSNNDPRGHGTHCAGIAAAVSNNGVGVASFSRDNSFIQVSSIKVLGASGMGTQKTIIDGMIKAADAEVDVISLSLGGRTNQSKERAYQKAVAYANSKGAIVVVAAGNSNRNAKDFAPASVPGVITVSAIDNNLDRAVFSNYITDLRMGIAAPGVNIYSTMPGGKYANLSGTSMATPYVAGLVGLLKSLDPSLNTQNVYELLMQTGKSTKQTDKTGYLIQPYRAVRQLTESRAL
jgi:thermitase